MVTIVLSFGNCSFRTCELSCKPVKLKLYLTSGPECYRNRQVVTRFILKKQQ